MSKIKTSINKFASLVPLDCLVKSNYCGYCKGSARKDLGLINNTKPIHILKCLNCELVSVEYFPNQDFLNKYYSELFPSFIEQYNSKTKEGVTFSKPIRFAKRLRSVMPSDILNSHNLHILDFGGADGSLSIEFAKSFKSTQNIFITIVDFGSNIGGCSNPNISIRKVHDIPKDVTFDLIIASATIEMLPETGEIISRLMNLLKSAGSVLFIRTNYIIPFKRFFPFIDFAFPAHLHDIGPQFWRNFARTESANIKIIRSEPSISELNFLDFPFRWAVSTFFKLPGRIEARIFPNNLYRFWRFVGAWEVVILKINS